MSAIPKAILRRLDGLYLRMGREYQACAEPLGLTCAGCHLCCETFFRHHTWLEWAHLRMGLDRLEEGKRKAFEERAAEYVRLAGEALGRGEIPRIVCPLNEDGLCGLYAYRPMICRLHGVPTAMTRPDGRTQAFPGCDRAQALAEGKQGLPVLDRTGLYRLLAALEQDFAGSRLRSRPRPDLTVAEMVVSAPPF